MKALHRTYVAMLMLIMAFSLITAGTSHAQLDTGSIEGTVHDSTGAVIPGASINCLNTATMTSVTVKTNGSGDYNCASLPVAVYSVTARANGFSTGVVSGIHLNTSELHRTDVTLKAGKETDTVEVSASQVQVNTLTTDLGTVIGEKQVADLPLNGRSFTDLTALVPGSVISGQFGQTSLGGTDTSIIGTNVLLDGADSTRIDSQGLNPQFGREAARITRASVDSIEQFSVLQGDYSAEYGRSLGDVVNVITKSGGNTLHGEAFEFFRNNALDAKNYFALPGQSTPLNLNQFGGNLSGPIVKDKLFYFANYEGVRQTVTNSGQYAVINTAERAQAIPAVQPIINAIPVGNGGPDGQYFDYYNAALVNTLREDTGSGKLNWAIRPNNNASVRYNVNNSYTSTAYGPAIGATAGTPATSQFLKLSDTWIGSPTLTNEAGFAINSVQVVNSSGGGAFPVVTIGCFFCNIGVLPGPALFSEVTNEKSYQYLDSLTKIAGNHALKFGLDFRHNLSDFQLNTEISLFFSGNGQTLSNIDSLLTDTGGFAESSIGYPFDHLRNTNYALFAQDDWRVNKHLTVNYGLRYEFNTAVHDKYGKLANFDIATQTLDPLGAQIYSPAHDDFAPRVGLIWDPRGTGTTVVRAGYGVFFLPTVTGAVGSLAGNTSNNISVNIFQLLFGTVSCNPAVTLTYPIANTVPTCTPAAPETVVDYDQHARDSYTEHWSAGMQQQLARNIVLDVNYVGSHGVKLPAGAGYAGTQFNIADPYGVIAQANPAYSTETFYGSYLDSDYNSLQAAVRAHLRQLTMDLNYTWAHEFDDAVNIFSNFDNPTNPRFDFSEGDIDVRNTFTADFVYNVPTVRHLPLWLGSGWQLNNLDNLRSGFPVNITTGSPNNYNTPQRPDLVAGVSIYPAHKSNPNSELNAAAFTIPTPVPSDPASEFGTLKRNAARGPGFAQFDLSLFKNTHINDRINTQFRAEFFNIFNHPEFTNPDADLQDSLPNSDGFFGKSLGTVNNLVGIGGSRQVQLAFKLIF